MKLDPRNTSIQIDPATGTVRVHLDIVGDTPLEHVILAEFFGKPRQVMIVPRHQGATGQDLRAEFTVADNGAIPRAQRRYDNDLRKADGRPSVEEEEAKRRAPKAPATSSQSASKTTGAPAGSSTKPGAEKSPSDPKAKPATTSPGSKQTSPATQSSAGKSEDSATHDPKSPETKPAA